LLGLTSTARDPLYQRTQSRAAQILNRQIGDTLLLRRVHEIRP
jgi:hypothetical protein